MVRHGQYVHDSERHLTELGKEQAEVTGKRLVDLGIKFDKIWYSDVTRATETSRIIEKHLPEVSLTWLDFGLILAIFHVFLSTREFCPSLLKHPVFRTLIGACRCRLRCPSCCGRARRAPQVRGQTKLIGSLRGNGASAQLCFGMFRTVHLRVLWDDYARHHAGRLLPAPGPSLGRSPTVCAVRATRAALCMWLCYGQWMNG